jgi:pimeloyl-ACP methyl ester carboxylesterase
MRVVGVPAIGIFFMRLVPGVFRSLRAAAHTLPHEFAVLGDTQRGGPLPEELGHALESITVPTLVLSGGKSPPWLGHAARRVAESVADGRTAIVPGQDHNVTAKAVALHLVRFFLEDAEAATRPRPT